MHVIMCADPYPTQKAKLSSLRNNRLPTLRSGLACKTVKVGNETSWRLLANRYSVPSISDLIRINPKISGDPKAEDTVFLPPCINGGR